MKNTLRIIFLDFDGVVNNIGSFSNGKMDPIDPYAIELLNSLVKETDARIVISSSWRIGHSLNFIQVMMAKAGFEYPERIIGATIELSEKTNGGFWTTKTRGQEIDIWLNQVPVDSFVIFDDNDDMDPVKDHLIQTTFENGLQKKHIERAKIALIGT